MATAFRIHEDIENNTEPTRNEKKNLVGKNNGKDKRPTLAILNSVALDNRNNATHAHKSTLNALNNRKPINNVNDENAVPNLFGKKQESKVPVDQFKAFTVFEEKPTDENVPPSNHEESVDELDCSAIDTLYSGARLPLQEIHQDVDTPSCVREILSPMSIDKSLLEINTVTDAETEVAVQQLAIDRRLAAKVELDHFFEVDEYRQDILEYLLEAELRHRPKPMYMRKQPDISHSMRTVLIDWLVEVGEEYRLQSETLCLAASYIDRFLSVMSVVRAKLQLVGTAAMFIAAKYEEIYPPDVGEFVYITDNTYTKTQVLRMEQLILKVLKFDLCVPTTSIFLNAYPVTSDVPKEVKYLSQFFCELSLLEAEPYLQYTPSVISASAVALARYNSGYPIWSSEMETITGYKVQELTEIIMHLAASHHNSVNSPQQAVQDKYKSSKFLEVAARQPAPINEDTLSRAIQSYLDPQDDSQERNENVRKMISCLLFD